MKKIININLSGRVIPIEDTAYDSLQRYIESLRRYFAHEEGRDEIINDIESRIAELMNDRIRKGASSITDTDIEEIITTMGRVEDFEEVGGEPATAAAAAGSGTTDSTGGAYQQGTRQRFTGRLYRDSDDKIIGGVCSGLANYLNVDPAIVRLVFAVITFGGFGFGILLYILAWIILPARSLDTYVGKRLFRNPDDRIIGGVAGGLGAYFNKPSWAIRLIFAAPLLLNILFGILNGMFFAFHRDVFPNFFFGSFTGTFLLTYIILWIVLPEAKTPYDKMEMRGEKVDINTIRQNVKEGMGTFKDRMQSWGEEVKESAQNLGGRAREFAGTRGAQFAAEVRQTARPVRSGIAHALGVVIKAFFLLIFGSIAFALFVALIVLLFGGGSAVWSSKDNLLDFALGGFWQHFFFWGTVVFLFLVPIVAFITWLVRRFMKVRSRNHYLGYIFGGLWFLGIICAGLLASALVKDTVRRGEIAQPVTITQPAGGRLLVRIDEPRVRYSGDLLFIEDGEGFDLTGDTMRLTDIKLRVVPSDDSTAYGVIVRKQSRGRSRAAAEDRATQIVYNTGFKDSVLSLGSGFAIDKYNKYRGQRVMVEIKVPVGKKIRFDQSVVDKLDAVHIRFNNRYDDRRWRRNEDFDWYDDDYFNYKTDVDYVMMPNGRLEEVGATSPVYNERTDTGTRRTDTSQQDTYRMQNPEEEVTTFETRNEKPVLLPAKKEIGGDVPTPMPMPFIPTIF
ncbi:PspC domain-containing protein [Flavisolibacter nicotianae]|uniref:PspC domain-containing protein n=1 Tax=Flavisolibacter nicotianae TaxID=2364882 RepID=UPI000EAC7A00|nr:PspC domain-containing protein [Flavisolibacter nicotianae]